MIKSQGDPLLVAARILVVFIIVVLVACLVAVGAGIAALLTVGEGELASRIAKSGAPGEAFWVVIGGFALVAIAIGFAAAFFRVLHRIVLSVDHGDPFDPINAARLRQMGWLGMAGQLLLLPLGGILAWLAPYLEKLGERVDLDFGLDPAGILLILILFILARVFRHGTAMQTDLEGTV